MARIILLGLIALCCAIPTHAEKRQFEFVDSWNDTFVISLKNPRQIRTARKIIAQNRSHIVAGTIEKRFVSYNSKWSYHLIPKSIVFPEVAIEVCDSAIAYVEKNIEHVGGSFLPRNAWCPWSSKLTREIR